MLSPQQGISYLVPVRKLYKIRNVSFGDIFIFIHPKGGQPLADNSLMLVSPSDRRPGTKKKNLIQNNSFHKTRQFPFRHYLPCFTFG